jgi:hypothetical protein
VTGTEPAKAPFKDPRPSVERISQLAQRVLTGDILLPKFQRDFVWPRSKVLGLLDSIARNYPIGSILLWQSKQPLASERSIAGLEIAEGRPDYPVNYLLDGQQRISTVCGALYWKPNDDPDSLWNIVYDLRSGDFQHRTVLDEPPLTQVPLRYLADPATFFKRMAALDDAELRSEGDRLFNRFQDYMIAAVTLGDMPVGDIAPIFERINSTATPLTIVDLMRAATWGPDFDLRDAIDDIAAGLKSRSFHTVSRKTMLRAIAAGAGYGFAVADIDQLREKSTPEMKTVVDDVSTASKRAVDFLSTHIGVPRAEAMPYANQFAVLTELFRMLPIPNGEQFTALERWFWRTTLSGYFGGWNTGQMAHDLKQIRAFAADDGTDTVDVPAPLPRSDIWKVTQFRSNSAVSKMVGLLLAFEGPVDMLTGQKVDARKSLAWNNDREFHHFFPRAFLKKAGYTPGKANAVGNIVLLSSASNISISDKAPSEYLKELIDDVGEPEALSRLGTLLVSKAGLDAALQDDYIGFLEARSQALQARALSLIGEVGDDEERSALDVEGEVFVDDEAASDSSEPPLD